MALDHEAYLVVLPVAEGSNLEARLSQTMALEGAAQRGAHVARLHEPTFPLVPTLWLYDALQARNRAKADELSNLYRGELHELSLDPASADYASLRADLVAALRLTDAVT